MTLFLGMRPNELLNNIEDFLLELGHGFCFEAKQKRIVIGEQHYFVDLVFYHRILKCHVLVELKLAEFNPENIGQLNTYLHWYKKNVMTNDDNPPIGSLRWATKTRYPPYIDLLGPATKTRYPPFHA